MPLTLPVAVDIVLGRAPIPEGVTRADADLCAAVHAMLRDPKRYPLAAVRLWRPECLRCDDRTKPGAAAEVQRRIAAAAGRGAERHLGGVEAGDGASHALQ